MNRKRIWGKSLTSLAGALLAVTAFIRDPWLEWAYAGVITVFVLWMLVTRLILPRLQARAKPVNTKWQEAISTTELALLRHVNHRVSAFIHSVYPDAAWEWCCATPERIAAEGGTGRIRLFDVPDFNFAEVTFDTQAQISCEMMLITPLAEACEREADKMSAAPLPKPVDPAVWYDIQGRGILETLVADLNSSGHSSLAIKETGEICVMQADKEIVKGRFKNMPERSCWPGIVKILEKAGLAATASDDGIQVSW